MVSRIVAVDGSAEICVVGDFFFLNETRLRLDLSNFSTFGMRDNPKRGQDTLLVKVLITATGVYPVGTLVILDSHELAVVAQANPDPDLLHRPTVRVISDPMVSRSVSPSPWIWPGTTLPRARPYGRSSRRPIRKNTGSASATT